MLRGLAPELLAAAVVLSWFGVRAVPIGLLPRPLLVAVGGAMLVHVALAVFLRSWHKGSFWASVAVSAIVLPVMAGVFIAVIAVASWRWRDGYPNANLMAASGAAMLLLDAYPRQDSLARDSRSTMSHFWGHRTSRSSTRPRARPGHITHLNRLVMHTVDQIVATDPEAVFVLMSDHGMRFPGEQMDRFRNLLAICSLGQPRLMGDAPTLVNVFPRVLNAYLVADVPLPADTQFTGTPGAWLSVAPFEAVEGEVMEGRSRPD